MILVFMLRLINDRKLMGEYANKKGYNAISGRRWASCSS